jgi:hypothetical protein
MSGLDGSDVRAEVARLVELGRFPNELDVTEDEVQKREEPIRALSTPVSDAEARLLLGILGEDDFWGMAWSIVTLIESAPGYPDWEGIEQIVGDWRDTLWRRALKAGYTPPVR